MKTKRTLFGLLVLSLLACNFITQMIVPPTATPTATQTFTPTATFTPSPTPLVPAYIPPQCDASAPLATIPPELAVQPTPQFTNERISKGMQLRILDDIDEIVSRVYVYPDYNGKDWKAIVRRYRSMIEAGLETEAFYREMQNMINELGDEHSSFISPAEVRQSEAELKGESRFVGVGLYSNVDFEKGKIIVISTFPGSPAEYAGLQAHDSILLVDGQPITAETGIRTLGPECTAVILTVQSPGESPREVMLIRSEIEGGVPVDARLVSTTDGSKIGYIFIPSFFDETLPVQIEAALQEFGPLDGLILDLRLNSGGTSTVAYPIMSFFVGGKLGDFTSRRDQRALKIEANPIHNSQTVPLVVMVSEETVSFGEIFAGVMRDARGAKITGETSLGNVEVLHGYDFEDGSVMWIASETFDSAFSEDDWEQTGIVPDLPAYAEWDTFYFETDPSIAAALELLGHK
ncbi:MAG: PDZ domain-containing protein [Chloroflexi bacterium]|nr:PDZ domain-containing protein [Chloroflexota bacterium]